jgi:hypothetical protein
VKVEELALREDTLIGELAYVISRLHRDTFVHSRSNDMPLVHRIVIPNHAVVCALLNSTLTHLLCNKIAVGTKIRGLY